MRELRVVSRSDLLQRPVFIGGIPRSGTSALTSALQRFTAFAPKKPDLTESRVFTTKETLGYPEPFVTPWARDFLLGDPAVIAELERLLAQVHPVPRPIRRTGKQILGKLSPTKSLRAARWRLQRRHLAVRAFLHVARRARGVERIVEKTPRNVLFCPEIRTTYPRSQVLLCMLNPVDVLASFRRRLARDRRALVHESRLRWMDVSVSEFADRYRATADAALSFVDRHSSRARLVRYEDLTGDPERLIGEVTAFLGVDAKYRHEGPTVERDVDNAPLPDGTIERRPSSWRHLLRPDEISRLQQTLAPAMCRLGNSS